ncbi:TetR/AcrR family transcriptional regulator [Kribbella sp. NPDC004536]|uniref:TetR/AcrR family transcriptional regulator n=1 Tax=Kribbella sp. NPDC004536 TaxID=3364106 RepID=UPI0036C299ED
MGLREERRLRTRQSISDVATRLFIEHGFESVTIAAIAAAADVAKMTVTNYFPRKEDLALDIHESFVRSPAAVVASRPAGTTPLEALRAWYDEALDRRDPLLGYSGPEFARMILDSPTLRSRLRELHDLREEALAAAVPKLEAALLSARLRYLFNETLHRTTTNDLDALPALAAEAFRQ